VRDVWDLDARDQGRQPSSTHVVLHNIEENVLQQQGTRKKPIRRQKKNSKHKIGHWEDSGARVELNNDENEAVNLIGSGVSGIELINNFSNNYRRAKDSLERQEQPDAGKLAQAKIDESSVLKTIINENAAKAANIDYEQRLYTDDYLIPVEDPDGKDAILEREREAILEKAPIIVIPPKPEAAIGQPDIFSMIPQDTLSFSSPSYRNHYVVRPKNNVGAMSTISSGFSLARHQQLWNAKVCADL